MLTSHAFYNGWISHEFFEKYKYKDNVLAVRQALAVTAVSTMLWCFLLWAYKGTSKSDHPVLWNLSGVGATACMLMTAFMILKIIGSSALAGFFPTIRFVLACRRIDKLIPGAAKMTRHELRNRCELILVGSYFEILSCCSKNELRFQSPDDSMMNQFRRQHKLFQLFDLVDPNINKYKRDAAEKLDHSR